MGLFSGHLEASGETPPGPDRKLMCRHRRTPAGSAGRHKLVTWAPANN